MFGLIGQTQRGVAERDQNLQAWHAVGNIDHRVTQVANLARQAAQKAAVEFPVCVVQHQRRLRQQRDHAPRQDVRAPADAAFADWPRDPVVDQCAGVGAGDRGIRGAQMAQPSEAEQVGFPVVRGRI